MSSLGVRRGKEADLLPSPVKISLRVEETKGEGLLTQQQQQTQCTTTPLSRLSSCKVLDSVLSFIALTNYKLILRSAGCRVARKRG